MKTYIFLILGITLFIGKAKSQDVTYDIPLSKPGEAGKLKINVYNASIKITASAGDKVTLHINDKRFRTGKRKSAEFYYQILEDNNTITILNRDASKTKGLHLELEVPADFSAELATYFGPTLEVYGLNGDVEANGYFTDIQLTKLNGSIIASTNHGKMLVDLEQVYRANTYFLSCYKKDLEILLPKNTSASLHMNNNFGKFESDFPLQLQPNEKTLRNTNYVFRTINGGGAEFKLINYFGKILVRSK